MTVETREQTIFRKFKAIFHHKRRVGVVDEIVFRDSIVLDCVADDSAEESNVRSGANLTE